MELHLYSKLELWTEYMHSKHFIYINNSPTINTSSLGWVQTSQTPTSICLQTNLNTQHRTTLKHKVLLQHVIWLRSICRLWLCPIHL
ncbi:hypothetical protein CIPAW_04G099900 [Carya illinoinensis]|uniref:Uncharacterized protein n=1 Tax=Carya illinoinensis TaxID=32201 RepID=A0A8T1QTX1_CARIL|nr:hypothetical protein CIPAW_04G099900 [Carya illinoinensis]